MKQAILWYKDHGFTDGCTSRIGYRKEHTNDRWYFEVAKIHTDGLCEVLSRSRGYSLEEVLSFTKGIKEQGYTMTYELI